VKGIGGFAFADQGGVLGVAALGGGTGGAKGDQKDEQGFFHGRRYLSDHIFR
jgi:hypothetical protein